MKAITSKAQRRFPGYDPMFERRTTRFTRDEVEHSTTMILMTAKETLRSRAGGLI